MTSRLEKIYASLLLIIFGVIVLHAPLTVWLGTLFPSDRLLIKSWKEILLVIAAVISVWLITRRRLFRELWSDWLLRLAAAYGLLHLLLIPLRSLGINASLAGLAIDLRYVVFFSLVYILLKLTPRYYKHFLITGAVGAVIVVSFATLQLFLPKDILAGIGYGPNTIQPYLTVDKNLDYVRINSTLRGPNPLGAYVVIVFGILAAGLARAKFNNLKPGAAVAVGTVVLFSSIALWVSYSRSALAAAVVAALAAIITGLHRFISKKAWFVGALIAVAIAGGFVASRNSSFVSNVILHENPTGGSAVSSNAAHVSSLESGWRRAAREPLGTGVGSTGSASLYTSNPTIIENQYLMIAHETGWLGLGLFIAIFLIIMRRLWRLKHDWLALGVFSSGLGLAMIGLLLPVWVDDTVSLIWWGLAGLVLGSYQLKAADNKKQSKRGAKHARA